MDPSLRPTQSKIQPSCEPSCGPSVRNRTISESLLDLISTLFHRTTSRGDIVYNISTTPQQLSALLNLAQIRPMMNMLHCSKLLPLRKDSLLLLIRQYTRSLKSTLLSFSPSQSIQPQLVNTLRIAELGIFTNVTASAAATGLR